MSTTVTRPSTDRLTGTVDSVPAAAPITPAPTPAAATVAAPAAASAVTPLARYAGGVARIGLGFIFLWAFIDKVLGLGLSTPSGQAWIDGSSPTQGYLSSATGPLASVYHSMAGNTIVDILFMFGLVAVGTSLMLGVASRLGTIGGIAMVVLMWSSHLWPTTNPFLDEHLIYAVTFLVLLGIGADRTFGLGTAWKSSALVKRFPILR